jgi:sensor c-di-GMP phosphodiesterase-like protein
MDEPVMFLVAERQPELELDLADALRLRALRVEYQPQFDLASGRGCGV